jgi:hypothetical protein
MTKRISFLFLSLSILLFGCNEIISVNISEETPVIILPTVNDTIASNPVFFKWEEMTGATSYRIEIVSPSFSNIQSFPVDSVVYGTNFSIGLDSLHYEFRITAINSGYESLTSEPRPFFVGTSQGSTGVTVSLNSPANGTYFNDSFDGLFSWYGLSDASSYTFELHASATFAGSLLHIQDQLVTNSISSFTGTDLTEGTYCWGVKAYRNGGQETNYSKRVFYIDKTVPGSASPSAPANGTTLNAGNIPFNWNSGTDQGTIQSPIISNLDIATDANFTNLLTPQTSLTNSKSVSLTPGTYYWRVRLTDQAGNVGATPTSSYILYIVP